MWVATADLPKSAGHPFYAQLNRVLDDAGFDTFVEAQCAQVLLALCWRKDIYPAAVRRHGIGRPPVPAG